MGQVQGPEPEGPWREESGNRAPNSRGARLLQASPITGLNPLPPSPPGSSSALLDLSGLDLPPSGTPYPAVPPRLSDPSSPEQPSTSISLLDDELMSLGEESLGPRRDGGGAPSRQ